MTKQANLRCITFYIVENDRSHASCFLSLNREGKLRPLTSLLILSFSLMATITYIHVSGNLTLFGHQKSTQILPNTEALPDIDLEAEY